MLSQSEHLVIVGAGHAGGRLAHHLRVLGHSASITLIGDEPHPPYERPALSKEVLLGSKEGRDLLLKPAADWSASGVELKSGFAVRRIDSAARLLELSDGSTLRFDHLTLATGGRVRKPIVPGVDDPRVLTLRNLEDALHLRAALSSISRLVIVGGGVIGLEVAAAARKQGADVTVVEASDRLMGRIGPPELSAWLLGLHRAAGIKIVMGAKLRAFEPSGPQLDVQVVGPDGGDLRLPADLVLVAIGVDPTPAIQMPPPWTEAGNIQVDARCRIEGAERCTAVGDAAAAFSPHYGRYLRQETWRNAENQSRALAEMMCGRDETYLEIPWMWTDQHDRNIQVVGLWEPGDRVMERGRLGEAGSSCVFTRDGVVTGGVLFDLGRERRFLERLVSAKALVDPALLCDPTIPLKNLSS